MNSYDQTCVRVGELDEDRLILVRLPRKPSVSKVGDRWLGSSYALPPFFALWLL